MRRGVTLIELLVIVAIIALLLAIMTPSLVGILDLTEMLRCASNMRQLGIATMEYAANNGERFPGPNWLRPGAATPPAPSPPQWVHTKIRVSEIAAPAKQCTPRCAWRAVRAKAWSGPFRMRRRPTTRVRCLCIS